MDGYIGRYKTERVLGTGAFATVWLAYDDKLRAWIALKVLAENWSHDDDVRRRFAEEAQILWRANSDHIVRVHTVDELPDGRPYFVMDYIDGGTLEQRMAHRAASGGFTIDEAVQYSLDIADGLRVAHALGIAHRDLKPANVMIGSIPEHHRDERAERLVLVDFGIAKSLAGMRGTTIATGTPHYMAPEQADGRADARSDIYAAGVVSYELLSGQVPYPYDSLREVVRAQSSGPPRPLTELRSDVSPELAEVVQTALAADPDLRWQSIDQWADALRAARRGEPAPPVAATPPDAGPESADAGATGATPPGADPADAGATLGPEALAGAAAAVPPSDTPPSPPGAPAPGAAMPPPAAPPPSAPAAGGEPPRRRKRWKVVVPIVAVLALLAGAVAAVVVLTGDDEADGPDPAAVVLEPIASVGIDPFTESIVPSRDNLDDLPQPPDVDTGSGAVTQVIDRLNPSIGELPDIDFPDFDLPPIQPGEPANLGGSAPGLYGGTNVINVCNKAALVDFLDTNVDKARAWAAVHGIDVDAIDSFVDGLTDMILQVDTLVTNHGFANGSANPINSVLQAGTAVLVDKFGVPRVRCYCGNPLLPAEPIGDTPTVTGTAWPGFDIDVTVVVNVLDEVPQFAVDDILGDDVLFRIPGTDATASSAEPFDLDQPTEEPTAEVTPTPPATREEEPTPAPTGGVIEATDYCEGFQEWSDEFDALASTGADQRELFDFAHAAFVDLANISPPEVQDEWQYFASLSFDEWSEGSAGDAQAEAIFEHLDRECDIDVFTS